MSGGQRRAGRKAALLCLPDRLLYIIIKWLIMLHLPVLKMESVIFGVNLLTKILRQESTRTGEGFC